MDITPCFERTYQQQRWQAKTQVLLTERVAFLHWICAQLAQPIPMVPVPLLRDTLLIHVRLTWLRHHGVPVPASKPRMIGRKFADLYGHGSDVYGALGNVMIKAIYDDIAKELELSTPFDPNIALAAQQSVSYRFPRALIESRKGGSHVFVSEGQLIRRQLQVQPGVLQQTIQDDRQFEGWRHKSA